jgi:hypothetical protein
MTPLIRTLRAGAIAAALALPFLASATDYRLSFGGVFDIVDDSTDNPLTALLGTPFAFSVTASDDPARASYSEVASDGTVGWCFCDAPFVASASTAAFSFTGGAPVTLYGSNDRSATAGDGTPVPPGTYDVFEWDGWWRQTVDGELIGDPGTLPGVNYNFTLVLAGAADWFDDGELPSATLDLSKIVYGTIGLVEFIDGVQVGGIGVDPLLHVEDGRLVGDGMSVSISAVPEAPSALLMLVGLGLWGAGRSRAGKAAGEAARAVFTPRGRRPLIV